ncbi:MAG TPA: N-acetylmuramoyl-L-alanine amidase [Arenimonas sp.]|nr:N-acetylmuramoyl-L-alanine amidase [Arenimonas sp.]
MDLTRQLPITEQLLPYEQLLEARPAAQIDLVVIHCTELPDLAMAREYGERALYPSGTGNSGHYYIDRDGGIYQYVGVGRTANHTRGYNPRSIGIEIVNVGRFPDWLDSRHQEMPEAYTEAQIEQLIALLNRLQGELPNLRFIAGHEDLDILQVPASDNPDVLVSRKRDPGPKFPWRRVLAETGFTPLTP